MKNVLRVVICACVIYAGWSIGFVNLPVYHNNNVTVTSGDTLWDIASRHAAPNEDVRKVLERIVEANRLAGSNLKPGQTLIVPVLKTNEGVALANK